ncbi:hypothetical protein OAU50_02615 [Planctomycetota bacterium]|nr:hypothetical protein [Planctomycetota bacterium]
MPRLGKAGGGTSGKTIRRGGGGGAPAVDPATIPSWELPSSDVLESASSEERPLVIYFPTEKSTDADWASLELAELSHSDAIFIKIPFNADREKSAWAEESVVPAAKLLSDNPSREYSVPVNRAMVIVADSFGNDIFRLSSLPKADQLKGYLKKVSDKTEKMNKKLQKNLDKANEALEKEDRAGAIKAILKNFKEDKYGVEPMEETVRLYHEIIEEARAEIEELTGSGDVDGLKKLAKDLKKTDAEAEIKEAIKGIS